MRPPRICALIWLCAAALGCRKTPPDENEDAGIGPNDAGGTCFTAPFVFHDDETVYVDSVGGQEEALVTDKFIEKRRRFRRLGRLDGARMRARSWRFSTRPSRAIVRHPRCPHNITNKANCPDAG